jgi:hypothetical protein
MCIYSTGHAGCGSHAIPGRPAWLRTIPLSGRPMQARCNRCKYRISLRFGLLDEHMHVSHRGCVAVRPCCFTPRSRARVWLPRGIFMAVPSAKAAVDACTSLSGWPLCMLLLAFRPRPRRHRGGARWCRQQYGVERYGVWCIIRVVVQGTCSYM